MFAGQPPAREFNNAKVKSVAVTEQSNMKVGGEKSQPPQSQGGGD